MTKVDLKAYARRGAEHRLIQLRGEIAEILRHFPDLDTSRRAKNSPLPPNELAALGGLEAAAPRRRRRRKMTASQRKAIGERMRAYWAGRKAKK